LSFFELDRFLEKVCYSHPMTLGEIVIAGVAGGAAKEISQSAWQLGQKWITSYFEDHNPAAIAKAEENAAACVNLIAHKVQQLEEDTQLNRALFDRALVEPDFGILLQKALLGAAQTEDKTKREVLAEIVTNRLTAESESLYAVAAQTAAETVAKCTPVQLKILAFAANISKVRIYPKGQGFTTREAFVAFSMEQFEVRFAPLVDFPVTRLDTHHLEALSCLNAIWVDYGSRDREFLYWRVEDGEYHEFLREDDMHNFPSGIAIHNKWRQLRINDYHLSTTGSLIGVLASDSIAGMDSNSLTGWKNPTLVPPPNWHSKPNFGVDDQRGHISS
jgi:hypothetical protein